MAKLGQPAWVKRILKLLAQAGEKDADRERFGAHGHQYRLAAPVGEDKIQAFELQYGVRLPEEYRNFLLLAGDGGAGPYCGLYGLKELKKELERGKEESYLQAGILPIGSQGCTLMTGLMLGGPYCGQVVYFDLDYCSEPIVMREKGFLAWYERWLREVIADYDDEEQGFGLCLDGNPRQLQKLYEQTDNPVEKIEIIESCYKFRSLPGKQKTYFKQACAQEADVDIRVRLIKMLAHFHVEGMTGEIEKLWEYGAFAEAISIITYEGGWAVKERWYRQVIEKLPKLHGDGFWDACYTIKGMKDYPDVHAGILKVALAREDLDRNSRSVLFYCIRNLQGKEEVLDYFLNYLPGEEDTHLLIYAIQAMEGVKERRLQEIYVELLDKYKTHENAKFDYKGSQMVLRGGCCMGASRPEGQIVSNLMHSFDYFGLDYRGAWKLLMDEGRWKEWKRQQGFAVQEV